MDILRIYFKGIYKAHKIFNMKDFYAPGKVKAHVHLPPKEKGALRWAVSAGRPQNGGERGGVDGLSAPFSLRLLQLLGFLIKACL